MSISVNALVAHLPRADAVRTTGGATAYDGSKVSARTGSSNKASTSSASAAALATGVGGVSLGSGVLAALTSLASTGSLTGTAKATGAEESSETSVQDANRSGRAAGPSRRGPPEDTSGGASGSGMSAAGTPAPANGAAGSLIDAISKATTAYATQAASSSAARNSVTMITA